MDTGRWAAVDHYLTGLIPHDDDTLAAALASAAEAGLPPINVSATQGKFLHLLTRITGARRVLEVGTLAGYSTIWLARGVPADGSVVTIEIDPAHAQVARENLERAGVAGRVDVRVGPALDILPTLRDLAPFDLVFIDADKANNSAYFQWAIDLGRPGTIVITDNVVRAGAIVDATSDDAAVIGTREFLTMLGAEQRVDATALQTVGTKGWDGFSLAVVR